VRYAILAAGQSNTAAFNQGPLDGGQGDLAPAAAAAWQHPHSRLVMISTRDDAGIVPTPSPSALNFPSYTATPIVGQMPARGQPMPGTCPVPSRFGMEAAGITQSVGWVWHFARQLLGQMRPQDELWIINAAFSGSSVQVMPLFGGPLQQTWRPDDVVAQMNHFREARQLWNDAIDTYQLVPAVLCWHQGESDCTSAALGSTLNPLYQQQLVTGPDSVLRRIRSNVHGAGRLPILVGTLWQNFYTEEGANTAIQQVHDNVATLMPGGQAVTIAMSDITAVGATYPHSPYSELAYALPSGKPLHFNASAMRLIGQRAYQAYMQPSLVKPMQFV